MGSGGNESEEELIKVLHQNPDFLSFSLIGILV